MSIDMPDADYSVSHDGSSQHPEDGVHEKEAEDNIVEDEPELEQDQGDLSISPAASDPDGESNSREDFLRVAIEPPVPIQRNSRSPIRNSFESSDENQATKQVSGFLIVVARAKQSFHERYAWGLCLTHLMSLFDTFISKTNYFSVARRTNPPINTQFIWPWPRLYRRRTLRRTGIN